MMRAGTHPSLEDLALFAENAQGIPMEEIEQHLATCEECSNAVLMHYETQSAGQIGLLVESSTALTGDSTPAAKPRRNPFAGLFSGIVANLVIGEGLSHLHHAPGLAGGHEHPADPLHENSNATDVRNAPGAASDYLHGRHEAGTGTSMHERHVFHQAPHAFGLHPTDAVSDAVHQQYSDTCAIQCQHLILNQFGIPVSETQLVREAIHDGIYSPGHGTKPGDVGRLLEDHGLPVHRYAGANVFNLAVELGKGHKVIVGVDSGSLWHTNSLLGELAAHFGFTAADHAVIVSGINTHDPQHPTIIVTDPGTGDVAKEYPVHDFLEAWHGSHFTLVATADPAPPTLPEMAHFDYSQGHISQIGAVPYEFAAQLAQQAVHEADPSVLARVDDAFLSFVHGDAHLDHYTGTEGHGDYHHAASDLLSAAHGDSGESAQGHFSSSFHDSGISAEHGPFHDHADPGFDSLAGSQGDHLPWHHDTHHDVSSDHGSGDQTDPFTFPGDDDHQQ
jgi:hypothetical protein